jgi:hypothetical protein
VTTVTGVALALLLAPSSARADYDTHFFLGATFSPFWNGTVTRVDGQRASEGEGVDFALELAGSRRVLVPWLALRSTARVGGWSTVWSDNRGEGRGHFEIEVGPELRIPMHRATFRASVPFGYSFAWIRSTSGRSVRQEYAGGHGLSFGLSTVLELWGQGHHGGYFGLAYLGRVHSFRRETELIADPSVWGTERVRFTTAAAAFTGGYALRF